MKTNLTNVKLCIVGCMLFLAGAVWTGLGNIIAFFLGLAAIFAGFRPEIASFFAPYLKDEKKKENEKEETERKQ